MPEEDFIINLERLNALLGAANQFSITTAHKRHEDAFGKMIEEQDTYYKRHYGTNYQHVLRLSRSSMETVLFLLLTRSPLKNLADNIIQAELESLAKGADILNNLRN